MFKRLFIVVMLAALSLAACSAQRLSQEQTLPGEAPFIEREADGLRNLAGAPAAEPVALDMATVAQSEAPAANGAVDRLVIKNVNLALIVQDPLASVDRISALAESMGGFVVSSNVYQASTDAQGNKIMQATMSIRVPVARLNETLAQLKGMAVEVDSENVSGEDVTAQYTDLESQLRNLEAAEKQLQKIMDGAVKTEDVLNVYNELVAVRGQIEQVKGQMKYYRESAAMSLISINLIPDALSQPLEVGGWKPEGVAKEAVEALVRALQEIATAAIWLGVYVLPLALLFGVPGYLLVRFALRRMRKPKATTA